MSGNIKIVIDKAALTSFKSLACEALVETAGMLENEVRNAQVMPRRSGALSDSMYLDVHDWHKGIVSLSYPASIEYARILYYHPEYNFYKGINPNAQGEWFKPWLKGGAYADRPKQIFEGYIKMKMGK